MQILPLDFDIWKTQYENETNTSFVRSTGDKTLVMIYYYCNRSGHFLTGGKDQRSVKSQGTCEN